MPALAFSSYEIDHNVRVVLNIHLFLLVATDPVLSFDGNLKGNFPNLSNEELSNVYESKRFFGLFSVELFPVGRILLFLTRGLPMFMPHSTK